MRPREGSKSSTTSSLTLKGHNAPYAREVNVCSLPDVLFRVKAGCTQRGLRSIACVRARHGAHLPGGSAVCPGQVPAFSVLLHLKAGCGVKSRVS